MTEETQTALRYPDVLDLPPSQALRLGVDGNGPQANRDRAARAEAIIEQADTAINRAYANSHWMNEPDMPEPQMVHVLARNDGDMVRAVQDPRVVEYVRDGLGLKQQVVSVYDDWSDEPQPIFGRDRIIDPLRDDPAALSELRDAVNTLRAQVGVGPIDEANLRVASGVDRPDSSPIQDLAEARSLTARSRPAAAHQNIPGGRPAQGRGIDVPF